MSVFGTAMSELLAPALQATFGATATYTTRAGTASTLTEAPFHLVAVMTSRDGVQRDAEGSAVVERATLDVDTADLPIGHDRGDTVTVDSVAWSVDNAEARAGARTRLHLVRSTLVKRGPEKGTLRRG